MKLNNTKYHTVLATLVTVLGLIVPPGWWIWPLAFVVAIGYPYAVESVLWFWAFEDDDTDYHDMRSVLRAAVTELYGPRCGTFEPTCLCCKAHRWLDLVEEPTDEQMATPPEGIPHEDNA